MDHSETVKKYMMAGLALLPTKEDKSPDVSGTWMRNFGVDDFKNCHGVGIKCGVSSGGLECYDFDNHYGDAKDVLSTFITGEVKEIFDRNKLPIENTLNGGFHLLFRCKTIEGNKKLASRPKKNKHDKWVPDAIIETRGEGGYFVSSPTEGYRVVRNDITNIPVITEAERKILLEVALSFNTWHVIDKVEQEKGERPGDLYNKMPESVHDVKIALQNAGWVEVRDKEWRRPDKDRGISATLGRVAEGIFYCFSSSAHPFDMGSAYTQFQVITLLEHNGDFSVCAKELVKRYGNSKPQTEKEVLLGGKKAIVTESEYEGMLKSSFINLEIPITKPPIIMKIRDYEIGETVERRLFTLGNFSCITGKSKSKKTFLTSLLLATATSCSLVENKFTAEFPDNKRFTVLFDTEQSEYDAYITAKRVPKIIGSEFSNFGAFDLREYTPLQRCAIIDYAISKYKDNIGYIVIDGIADLATAINDEEEASRVVSLLMRWTKIYNCHITTVIHQNKNDSYATGHLGSAIMKKAECVISVQKSEGNFRRSEVSCDLMRGASDFNDFEIEINDRGLPAIVSIDNMK